MNSKLSYVEITDEMVARGIEAFDETFRGGDKLFDEHHPVAMRAALEAALSCAPEITDEMAMAAYEYACEHRTQKRGERSSVLGYYRGILEAALSCAPSVRRPMREKIVSAVEPFLETYASPEQIADAVLALFDWEPKAPHKCEDCGEDIDGGNEPIYMHKDCHASVWSQVAGG